MFHMLRRQMLRGTRKPLIVMTPKSLLRNKNAVSSMDELADGRFQDLIPDSFCPDPSKARRVVVCGGKVYYDLVESAQARGLTDVGVVRVEQLYPFPRAELAAELKRFAHAKEISWCQEEPMNQGAWYQIQHHLRTCLQPGQVLDYTGRARSAAPACGHLKTHVAEQAMLLDDALVNPADGDHVIE
jgi:2-oxoglutarate dehydrogenase E1 component